MSGAHAALIREVTAVKVCVRTGRKEWARVATGAEQEPSDKSAQVVEIDIHGEDHTTSYMSSAVAAETMELSG